MTNVSHSQTGSGQCSVAPGPALHRKQHTTRQAPHLCVSFWSTEQINTFRDLVSRVLWEFTSVKIINQNVSAFVPRSHPPQSTCSTSQVFLTTRGIENPQLGEATCGKGRVRTGAVSASAHAPRPVGRRSAAVWLWAGGHRTEELLPAWGQTAVLRTPACVTGCLGGGWAGPHKRSIYIPFTTSGNCRKCSSPWWL